MDVVNHDVHNTFVFTEQDLPSFALKNKERAAALAQGIPAHLLRKQYRQTEQTPATQGRRTAPYSRRPIPSRFAPMPPAHTTALLTCISRENQDCREDQARGSLHSGAECRDGSLPSPSRAEGAGECEASENGPEASSRWCHQRYCLGCLPRMWPCQGCHSCLRHADTAQKTKEKPTKAKKMENKAARWPENQLMDAIARCFSEHKFWSIKAFRGRIQQPEAYLRECLDKIAVLHRSGSFANHWSLRPEYQSLVASLPKPSEDAAVVKTDVPSEEDDEDDIKMEDVL